MTGTEKPTQNQNKERKGFIVTASDDDVVGRVLE
jgi:hypothetical protein